VYHVAASFEIPSEHHQEFIDAALEDGRKSAANERGTLRFEVIKDSERPNLFYLSEAYRDEAAFKAHCAGPYFQRFFEIIRGFLVKETPLIKGTRIDAEEDADRAERDYEVSRLPLLRDGRTIAPDRERELLFKMYDQAAQAWRELVGVRFKLLALVPSVSLILVGTIVSTKGPGAGLTPTLRVFACTLGLLVTLGLLIYELRNSSLHDDLVSRGRKIEDELGVDTGLFRGRLKGDRVIKHSVALGLVYGASIAAWVGGLVHLSRESPVH
jgi:(4S)-4-hydroxy-5-phosphonooxypentane-2,3-dione isomerase